MLADTSHGLSLVALTWFVFAVLGTGGRAAAAEPVTAIDILLLPDQVMIDRAQAANAELRKNYPPGFRLDATHRPHISLLHRFVRTKDLDAVYAAVQRVFDRERPVGWQLEGVRYFHVIFNGLGLPGIVVRPTPDLLRLQQDVIDAVEPYTVPDGTSAAFATTPAAPQVNASTIQYVRTFIPNQVGHKYDPHVTVGVGEPAFVERMEAAPFEPFRFNVAGAAIYQLGNFGTAQKKLWEWNVPATTSR